MRTLEGESFLCVEEAGLRCGPVMLGATVAVCHITKSIPETTVFTTAVRVRHGSPTSCLLFIIYVNDLIRMVEENCDPGCFLSWYTC